MNKTANYDVRLKSMDRKKYSSVAETDDNTVNNVSILNSTSCLFVLYFNIYFYFFDLLMSINIILFCMYNDHSEHSI
jgi:hypothetical protein